MKDRTIHEWNNVSHFRDLFFRIGMITVGTCGAFNIFEVQKMH